jgi:hypothetical protein
VPKLHATPNCRKINSSKSAYLISLFHQQHIDKISYKSLRLHGHDLPERKGSDLTDSFLASALSPYIDLVIVDKRTKENLRRTLQKVPAISNLLNRVEKASHYWDVAELL